MNKPDAPVKNPVCRPVARPGDARFSSGPCKKRPGWSASIFEQFSDQQNTVLGRSHRSKQGKVRLGLAIQKSRELLQIPGTHVIGITPASDTGAMEMALWSLLGAAPVDVLAWESFGKGWAVDVRDQLQIKDLSVIEAGYGSLPDLSLVRDEADLVFTWNGTTSGVKVPNGNWLNAGRTGLAICDATSAAFAQELPWEKLDVVTWSWQKVMGGEAAHGMIVLSKKAIARLQSHTPDWPVPKLFRLMKKGKLNEGFFAGSTINTPSMLCVEDYLDTLAWGEETGGLKALHAICNANLKELENWVEKTTWVQFLCKEPDNRSNTGVCLSFAEADVIAMPVSQQQKLVRNMTAMLEAEGIAFDIGGYRDAPPGLRIWCGATIETSDVRALIPWLDWAYSEAQNML